jgi:DnaJ-class molecular chaperone
MNFYTVLGIPRDADEEMIRSAYRALAHRYHPDRGSGSSAENFRQVNEAYETLIHSARRQEYDLALSRLERPLPAAYAQEDPRVYGSPRLSINRIEALFYEWFGGGW